jgi:hypothetical protein
MNTNDPIRMSDLRKTRAVAAAMPRIDAERQFKFSFALVIVLTLGTLTAIATTPMTGWENGYGNTQQMASLSR